MRQSLRSVVILGLSISMSGRADSPAVEKAAEALLAAGAAGFPMASIDENGVRWPGALFLVNTSSVSREFGLAIRDMIRALLSEAANKKETP